ncbi:uncharacterized protein LOC111617309 [Centruroides sculpturatus]|uniref:uncharacterized protein LOC111617309 n=1 Tax=Centruroides sculpturatus TaxID=218467 RepID=UPI000C6D2B10|nr:uncharacterized protein LOC111617309 [Centruroides sculpturatus]
MDNFIQINRKRVEDSGKSTKETVEKRKKYRKYDDQYLDFGFTYVSKGNVELPQCVVCHKVLAAESMLPNKLKRHLETVHIIWHKILNSINPISKLMQTKDFDLSFALDLLQNCKIFFKNLRSDSSFDKTIIDAKELATENDVEANFESTITRHHVRRRKSNLYEARDKPIKDPKEKYKIDFFFTIDQALNALDARFEQLSNHSNYFQFLYNIYDLNVMTKEMLLKHCKYLECILTDGDFVDINGVELAEEISALSALLDKRESLSNVLSLITKLNFAPNLTIALRMLLTIPITVASGEKSFSKLKLIKNFLRSATTQNRLN